MIFFQKQPSGRFGHNDSLGAVTEHGILFEMSPEKWIDSRKAPPMLTYWVIGRRFTGPSERQFYVCFHDSAQQNAIELAFKLGFGLSL